MGVSIYSIVNTVILFNLSVLLVAVLGRHEKFVNKYRTRALFLVAGLSLIRLVTPLDFTGSLIIGSYRLLPLLITIFNTPIAGSFTVLQICLAVWAAGSLFFLCKYLKQSLLELKRLHGYRPVSNEQAQTVLQALYPKAKLTVSPDVDVPKVAGIFRPHIYLPVLNLSNEELSWVLDHELQHFRNHDQPIKVFYLLLIVVFWWNPLLHRFHRDFCNLLELRCDAAVTSDASEDGKLTYLQTILKVIRQTYGRDKQAALQASALVQCETKSFVHRRFEVVMGKDARPSHAKVLSCVVLVLFFLSYFVIFQPKYESPEIDGGFDPTSENCYLIDAGDGTFQLFYDGSPSCIVTQEQKEQEPFASIPVLKEEKLQ